MSTARVNSLRILTTALGLTVFLIATVAIAGKPPSTNKCPAGGISTGRDCHIPVTTIISDVDANGLPATIASDGQGGYADGVNGVTSWLTDNGYNRVPWDWQFGVYASPSRVVNESLLYEDAVQPGDPHYTAPANPPFGFGTQPSKAHIEVKCTLVLVNMLAMTPGQTRTCPMVNKFNVNGQDYWLSPSLSFTHYAETTDVEVRCNAANSDGCNDWFIDPPGLGEAVGRLAQGSELNYGDFYMRFHIHITRP